MKASMFLKLLSVAQAGFDLYTLAQEAKAKESAGATQDDIEVWIDGLYEDSFKELNATP